MQPEKTAPNSPSLTLFFGYTRRCNMATKFCKTCNSDVDISLFSNRNASIDGLDRMCKSCKKEYRKTSDKKNKQHTLEKRRLQRLENIEHLRKQGRDAYQRNKEKRIPKIKEWQSNNVDLVKAYKSKSFEANKEEYLKRANERYHTEVGKEMHKIRVKRYNETDKGKRVNVLKRNKRKHIQNNTENTFTANDWLSCLEHFNNTCAYCGCDSKLSQDHVIPVSKLGSYTVDNIIPSCKPCNSSKRSSDFEAWYKTRPYYTEERYDKITNYIPNIRRVK